MSDNLFPSGNRKRLPVSLLLVILTVTAFLEELLVKFLLDMLPPMPKAAEFLLDATLLSVLIFPIFYFLVYRPMARYIAEIRLAQENLRTLSVAFNSKEPILITDAQANILRANKMFLKISGYSPEELIGKHSRILKTDRYGQEYYKKMWDQLLCNGTWSGETRIRDKQGNDFALGMVITAVKKDPGLKWPLDMDTSPSWFHDSQPAFSESDSSGHLPTVHVANDLKNRLAAMPLIQSRNRTTARAMLIPRFKTSTDPMAAPINIVSAAMIRRNARGLFPPAMVELAANPVNVNVNTVVVKSGTPRRRATAF